MRFPQHATIGSLAGLASVHFNAVGHDKCGVKADAKLADQLGVFLLVTGEAFEKGSRARLGNGADDGSTIFSL